MTISGSFRVSDNNSVNGVVSWSSGISKKLPSIIRPCASLSI